MIGRQLNHYQVLSPLGKAGRGLSCRRFEAPSQRDEQAEVRRWYARMLAERDHGGDAEKARRLLDEALAAYKELGMPNHVQMVETLGR